MNDEVKNPKENLKESSTMYKINPGTEDWAIINLTNEIDKGYHLQELDEEEITADVIVEYSRSIIVSPDYQREYRFTLNDESRLIESIFLGIPIPPIFLATDDFKGIRVFNVVDGQHRLRALHRFRNNRFKLTDLEMLSSLNGSRFEDLSTEFKTDFLSVTLQAIIFKDVPGTDFELEIFNRYNKGTKPLSAQEIRHAVFNSNFNEYINDFNYSLYKTKEPLDLYEAYNITTNRIQKKVNQEDMFTILSILEYGINPEYINSLDYANAYMEEKNRYFKKHKKSCEANLDKMKYQFERFNSIIMRLREIIQFPFSKEFYKENRRRNHKFQISSGMLLAGIFYEVDNNNPKYFDKMLEDNTVRDSFHSIVSENIKSSYIEDPTYQGSSTNSKKMKELVNTIKNELIE